MNKTSFILKILSQDNYQLCAISYWVSQRKKKKEKKSRRILGESFNTLRWWKADWCNKFYSKAMLMWEYMKIFD